MKRPCFQPSLLFALVFTNRCEVALLTASLRFPRLSFRVQLSINYVQTKSLFHRFVLCTTKIYVLPNIVCIYDRAYFYKIYYLPCSSQYDTDLTELLTDRNMTPGISQTGLLHHERALVTADKPKSSPTSLQDTGNLIELQDDSDIESTNSLSDPGAGFANESSIHKREARTKALNEYIQEHESSDVVTNAPDQVTDSTTINPVNQRIIDKVRDYQQELFEKAKAENVITVYGSLDVTRTLTDHITQTWHRLRQDVNCLPPDKTHSRTGSDQQG